MPYVGRALRSATFFNYFLSLYIAIFAYIGTNTAHSEGLWHLDMGEGLCQNVHMAHREAPRPKSSLCKFCNHIQPSAESYVGADCAKRHTAR